MDPGYHHPPVAGAPRALPPLLALLLQPEQTRMTVNSGLGSKWQEFFGGDINCVSACMYTCTCYVNACIHMYIRILMYTSILFVCLYCSNTCGLCVCIHTYICTSV